MDFSLQDPNDIVDWTHEREWRLTADYPLDLARTAILLPDAEAYQQYVSHAAQKQHDFLSKANAVVVLSKVFY